jgi:hypothetical protein
LSHSSDIVVAVGVHPVFLIEQFAMREWFALGWCPPDAWRLILPLLAQVRHAVDTIHAGNDG